MKPYIRSLLGALALAAPAVAQAPPAPPAPTVPAPAATGKVLVLDNHQLVDGEAIVRAGDQYRVRRTIGEATIPAARVLAVVEDAAAAYRFLAARAKPKDPDDRLRLARWCLANGLRAQALAEARAALQLSPNHREAQRVVKGLEASLAAARATPPPAPAPRTDFASDVPAVEPELPEFNPDSLGLFVTKVQPILMNACASCHATDRGGEFKLVRTYGTGNRRSTQANLAATLALLKRDDPAASPLLVKAVVPHGTSPVPPLTSRNVPPYRLLEAWVKYAVAAPGTTAPDLAVVSRPAPPETAPPAATPAGPPAEAPKGPTPFAEAGKSSPPSPDLVPPPILPAPPPVKPQTPPPGDAPPAVVPINRPPAPKPSGDPFDPDVFNRQMHPEKK
jgi:hypothetical protein